MQVKWWRQLRRSWLATKSKFFIRSRSSKFESGSATFFVLITMVLMNAVLYSLAHTGTRLINAQQSQFAADSSALGCVLAQQDSPQEFAEQIAEQIAEQNFAQVLEFETSFDQCVVVVEVDHVARRAVAVSVGGLDLPTLQR